MYWYYRICSLDKDKNLIIKGSCKEKKQKIPYKIGDKIKFDRCFHRKCARRFLEKGENSRERVLTSLKTKTKEGYVVGLRSVIMTDYRYYSGFCDYEGNADSPYATGTKETCLLVTTSAFKEPFLVRLIDIIKEENAN